MRTAQPSYLKSSRRAIAYTLTTLLLVPLFGWIGLGGWKQAAQWLVITQPPAVADAIVVLGGGIPTRPKMGFQLLHQGWAKRLIFVGDRPHVLTQVGHSYCPACDFARPEVTLLGLSRSTLDDLQRVLPHIQGGLNRRILLVTDPYHTRRADWIARHLLNQHGIEVRTISSNAYFKMNAPQTPWWQDLPTRQVVLSEWTKFLFYLPYIWGLTWVL